MLPHTSSLQIELISNFLSPQYLSSLFLKVFFCIHFFFTYWHVSKLHFNSCHGWNKCYTSTAETKACLQCIFYTEILKLGSTSNFFFKLTKISSQIFFSTCWYISRVCPEKKSKVNCFCITLRKCVSDKLLPKFNKI